MSVEAMKQALEALVGYELVYGSDEKDREAVRALRQAIEQAEKQEPIALETVYETIIHWDEGGGKRSRRELAKRIVDLYTAPQPQQAEKQEPVAWVNWCAATGKRSVSFECESELASQPLYTTPQP
jgi:hypothetical protein